jgi:N-acetylglucosaminyldiphosphoundecaprenol N-acetyl-beta-D-mannosaminyltransferase
MEKKRLSLLQIPIDPLSTRDVLDKIKLYISSPPTFIHIVSINPENIVIAQQNAQFKTVCQNSDLALTDGIGVLLAARLLGLSIPERVPGSILLPRLLDLAGAMSSRVVLIGSHANLADKIAKCYSRSYPEATFIGIRGYKNSLQPTKEEDTEIETIVRRTRPHFVFVALGSPTQEIWIEAHKKLFKESICMGVGGSFDYLAGASQKPPHIIRTLGMEWLYRLITQPWRIQRQRKRLPRFIGMILKEWIRKHHISS